MKRKSLKRVSNILLIVMFIILTMIFNEKYNKFYSKSKENKNVLASNVNYDAGCYGTSLNAPTYYFYNPTEASKFFKTKGITKFSLLRPFRSENYKNSIDLGERCYWSIRYIKNENNKQGYACKTMITIFTCNSNNDCTFGLGDVNNNYNEKVGRINASYLTSNSALNNCIKKTVPSNNNSNNSNRKASTSGCYNCSNSQAAIFRYYNKGAALPSTCSSSPTSGYSTLSYTNGYTCKKGNRYVTASTGNLKCGNLVYITTCTGSGSNKVCNYTYVNGINKTGKVNAMYLATSKQSCQTSNTTTKASTTPTPAPVIVEPVSPSPTSPNGKIVYAKEGAYLSGDKVICGSAVTILECDNSYAATSTCRISAINGKLVSQKTVVYRQLLVEKQYNTVCSSTPTQEETTCVNSELQENVADDSVEIKVCSTYKNGKVTDSAKPEDLYTCKEEYEQNDPELKENTCEKLSGTTEQSCYKTYTGSCSPKNEECETSKAQTDVKSDEIEIKVCATYKDGKTTAETDPSKLYTCAENYEKNELVLKDDSCKNMTGTAERTCHRTYTTSCYSGSKPGIEIASSLLVNNVGSITLKGRDTGSGIKGYYLSQSASLPTKTSNWINFDNTNYSYVYQGGAGLYFAWVISNSGSISDTVFAIIHDADLSTTASTLGLKDTQGNNLVLSALDNSTTAYNMGVVDSKYVRLSNTLKNNKTLAGFDSLSMGYETTVTSDKVAVYATLTSTDSSYVDGFAPRTVDLNYGRNVILIKIKNKDGKIRTYTIIVNRTDDRENNNYLASVKLSVGSISFDKYTTNYDIEVPKNTKKLSINATLDSTTSAYIKGYTPREITLDEDVTSAIIKVTSESGISRCYVFTFVKSGAEVKNTMATSTYLTSLSIPGTNFEFDSNVLNYSISIPYSYENVDIYPFAESPNASVDIEGGSNLVVGRNGVIITVTNGSKKRVYTLTIVRKEAGLNLANDTKLGTLTVKDYDIKFDPNVLDYTLKIKREKTLLITATPANDRSNVYIYGNNDLTGFSTVRIKVIAENGATKIYSLDIQKDPFNKAIETTAIIVGGVIILGAAIIIVVQRKKKKMKEYLEG